MTAATFCVTFLRVLNAERTFDFGMVTAAAAAATIAVITNDDDDGDDFNAFGESLETVSTTCSSYCGESMSMSSKVTPPLENSSISFWGATKTTGATTGAGGGGGCGGDDGGACCVTSISTDCNAGGGGDGGVTAGQILASAHTTMLEKFRLIAVNSSECTAPVESASESSDIGSVIVMVLLIIVLLLADEDTDDNGDEDGACIDSCSMGKFSLFDGCWSLVVAVVAVVTTEAVVASISFSDSSSVLYVLYISESES